MILRVPSAAPASSPRLAIVVSHPTQYYSPWFRWIARHAPLDVRVFYLWDFGVTRQRDPRFETTFKWDVDLLSGYASEFVPNTARAPGAENFRGFNNPELPNRLRTWAPQAVLLFGYAWATHLRAIAWARRHRVPIVFRGDSHFIGRQPPSGLRRLALRWLFRQFHACLYVGAANRDYFRALGVPGRKLFFGPHSVDHTLFDPARVDHQRAAAQLRAELGLSPDTRVLLFAGKFVTAKQPIQLLEAFLAHRPGGTSLVFVGDGPEKPRLLARAESAPPGAVHVLPFANQSEMPGRLLLADAFALPSRGLYETWGLAINEAMHMGVPALVSDRVGCQRDLVTAGETGWVFRAEDPASLADAVAATLKAVQSRDERERFRARVLARISGYTYRETTSGLLASVGLGLPSPRGAS